MGHLCGIVCMLREAAGFVYEFKGEWDDIGMGE